MKKVWIALCISAMLCMASTALAAPEQAQAEQTQTELKEEVQRQMRGVDVSRWESMMQTLPDSVKKLWDGNSASSLIGELSTGEYTLDITNVFASVLDIGKQELGRNLQLIVKLVLIALLGALLTHAQSDFAGGVGDAAGFAIYAMAVGVAIATFVSLLQVGRETISALVNFMQISFPVLLTLLTAVGGVASSGVFQPATALLSSSIATTLRDIVLPLILSFAALSIVANLSERAPLTRLSGMCKEACKWIVGITSVLFVGVVSLQGLSSAAVDGISIRTAKFALDKMVPFAGKFVSDTVDTVMGCTLLIKNAAGISAILIGVGVILTPLIRILAGVLAFRMASALSEPLDAGRLPKMLSGMGDALMLLFGSVMAVGAMFFITVGLLLGAGNANVMMR